MAIQIETTKPNWQPLKQESCIRVRYQPLLTEDHQTLVMLYFSQNATIHEHPADFDIQVICLEGAGFTSVGKEQSPIFAGDKVCWPAGKPHRLWTTDTEMITLMVEQTATTKPKSAEPVWEDVDSSMISAFKYDPSQQILSVIFHSNGIYQYFNVPKDIVDGLRKADSKGRYMRYAIIDMYDYQKGRG